MADRSFAAEPVLPPGSLARDPALIRGDMGLPRQTLQRAYNIIARQGIARPDHEDARQV
jgi:hypothetical protein